MQIVEKINQNDEYEFIGNHSLAESHDMGFRERQAKALGWMAGTAGLFAWVDGRNRPVVETVWWTDGSTDFHAPHIDEEVGHGWLILASPDAYAAIREAWPSSLLIYSFCDEIPCEFPGEFEGRSSSTRINQWAASLGWHQFPQDGVEVRTHRSTGPEQF